MFVQLFETTSDAPVLSVFRTETDCLIPINTGQNTQGYSVFSMRTEAGSSKVHRMIWEQENGPIPEGMVIDHVAARGCTERACVNIDHLAMVTHRENTLRGNSIVARYANRTHCANGHEFTEENTAWRKNGGGYEHRSCRTCERESRAVRWEREKARKAELFEQARAREKHSG